MHGRQTVGDSYRGFLKSFDVRIEVTPELLESSGNQGLMMRLYTSVLIPKDGRVSWARSGRYYMDLVRDHNGDWQIARKLTQTTADPIAGVQTAPDALATAGEMRRRFADIAEGQVHYWQGGPAATTGPDCLTPRGFRPMGSRL